MGIRDRPTSPGSPWQNGIAERLIGTLRRECLDQIVIFSEAHLRRILCVSFPKISSDLDSHCKAESSHH
jgi:transposase InsO family protein